MRVQGGFKFGESASGNDPEVVIGRSNYRVCLAFYSRIRTDLDYEGDTAGLISAKSSLGP
jgi:hypothetical protein